MQEEISVKMHLESRLYLHIYKKKNKKKTLKNRDDYNLTFLIRVKKYYNVILHQRPWKFLKNAKKTRNQVFEARYCHEQSGPDFLKDFAMQNLSKILLLHSFLCHTYIIDDDMILLSSGRRTITFLPLHVFFSLSLGGRYRREYREIGQQ